MFDATNSNKFPYAKADGLGNSAVPAIKPQWRSATPGVAIKEI